MNINDCLRPLLEKLQVIGRTEKVVITHLEIQEMTGSQKILKEGKEEVY